MTLEDAIGAIIGENLARSIIADMGIAWAVVATTADDRWETADPAAKDRVRKWLAKQKRPRHV